MQINNYRIGTRLSDLNENILNFLLHNNDVEVESVICVLDAKSEFETVCSLTENGSGNTSQENSIFEITQINDKLFVSSVNLLQLNAYLLFQENPVLIIFPEFTELHQKILREQNATNLSRNIWLIQVSLVIRILKMWTEENMLNLNRSTFFVL
jgi:hypothetical protein